jgi:uncharacterized protein YjbJ (UPF0337 family)
MNRDRIEGQFEQLLGRMQVLWGKLIHDPQRQIDGLRRQHAGRIRERNGSSKEVAACQLDELRSRYPSLWRK